MFLIFRQRSRNAAQNPSAPSIPQPFRLSEAVPLPERSDDADVTDPLALESDLFEPPKSQRFTSLLMLVLVFIGMLLSPTAFFVTSPPQTSGSLRVDSMTVLSRLAVPSFQGAAWTAEGVIIGFATALTFASWNSRRRPENAGIHHAWFRDVMQEARRETLIDVMAFLLGGTSVAIACLSWISLILNHQLGQTSVTAPAMALSLVAFTIPLLCATVTASASSTLGNYAKYLAYLSYLALWERSGHRKILEEKYEKPKRGVAVRLLVPVYFFACHAVGRPLVCFFLTLPRAREAPLTIVVIIISFILLTVFHLCGAWMVAAGVPDIIMRRSGSRLSGRLGLLLSTAAMLLFDFVVLKFAGPASWRAVVACLFNLLWLLPLVCHHRGIWSKRWPLPMLVQILGISWLNIVALKVLRKSGYNLVKMVMNEETAPESSGAESRDLAAIADIVVPANVVIVDAPTDDGSGQGKTARKGRRRRKKPTAWETDSRIVLAEGGESTGAPLRQAVVDTATKLMADAERT